MHSVLYFSSQIFSSLYKLLGVDCSSCVVNVIVRTLQAKNAAVMKNLKTGCIVLCCTACEHCGDVRPNSDLFYGFVHLLGLSVVCRRYCSPIIIVFNGHC